MRATLEQVLVSCVLLGLYTSYLAYAINAGQPISQLIQFYLGEVRLGVNSSKSEVAVLDDVSARLTVRNVSRELSGGHVTCRVTGESHVVSSVLNITEVLYSSAVNIRVAGKFHSSAVSVLSAAAAAHLMSLVGV